MLFFTSWNPQHFCPILYFLRNGICMALLGLPLDCPGLSRAACWTQQNPGSSSAPSLGEWKLSSPAWNYCESKISEGSNYRGNSILKMGTHYQAIKMKTMPRVNLGENKKHLSGELHQLFRSGVFEHFPGQLVPVPNHLFGEEIFPTSNLNLPWSNLGLFAYVCNLLLGRRDQPSSGHNFLSSGCREW